MLKKYPDQARERRHVLWAGLGSTIVGVMFYLAGAGIISCIFLLPGILFILVALFCTHAGFETAKRVGKFFEWFA